MYLGADVVGDFSAEGSIVHEEDVEILNVVHDEFLEAVGEMESGLLVGAVADLGHGPVASESASHPVVDAVSSPPAGSESAAVEVGLEADEFLSSLLDDSLPEEGGCLNHQSQ